MERSKIKAMDNFGRGSFGMQVANKELGLPGYAVKVAGSQGVGTAVEHVRKTELKRKAKRAAQKASRRGNR